MRNGSNVGTMDFRILNHSVVATFWCISTRYFTSSRGVFFARCFWELQYASSISYRCCARICFHVFCLFLHLTHWCSSSILCSMSATIFEGLYGKVLWMHAELELTRNRALEGCDFGPSSVHHFWVGLSYRLSKLACHSCVVWIVLHLVLACLWLHPCGTN